MRASLLVLGVLVLIVCLGNEYSVNGLPVPDPCKYFMQYLRPTSTTTPPPKTEKPYETREKMRQYKTILEEILYGDKMKKEEIREPEPPKPRTYDMNTMFAASMEFWTKFFNMF